MKPILAWVFSMITVAVFNFGCSDSREVGQSLEILIPNEVIGKWVITEYSDSGFNKTPLMASLTLQFNSSGSMNIFASDSVVNGTWRIVEDIGLDKVNMQLESATSPYSTLSGSWYVFSKDYPFLSLSHTSPGRSQILVMQRQ